MHGKQVYVRKACGLHYGRSLVLAPQGRHIIISPELFGMAKISKLHLISVLITIVSILWEPLGCQKQDWVWRTYCSLGIILLEFPGGSHSHWIAMGPGIWSNLASATQDLKEKSFACKESNDLYSVFPCTSSRKVIETPTISPKMAEWEGNSLFSAYLWVFTACNTMILP